MKIRPKKHTDYEDYAYSIGVNPEELSGFHIERVLPKDYKTRIKYSEIYNAYDEFDNDLYDEQEAFETSRANKTRQFTEKISIAEMDELSAEELVAYHKFLQDYREECQSKKE